MSGWTDPNRIVTAQPLPTDALVVTFFDGKFAAVHPVADYESVRARAIAFAKKHKFPVKVLPVTFPEALNFMGISREAFVASTSQDERRDMRALSVQALKKVLREENDGVVRKGAYDLLVNMGELEP